MRALKNRNNKISHAPRLGFHAHVYAHPRSTVFLGCTRTCSPRACPEPAEAPPQADIAHVPQGPEVRQVLRELPLEEGADEGLLRVRLLGKGGRVKRGPRTTKCLRPGGTRDPAEAPRCNGLTCVCARVAG